MMSQKNAMCYLRKLMAVAFSLVLMNGLALECVLAEDSSPTQIKESVSPQKSQSAVAASTDVKPLSSPVSEPFSAPRSPSTAPPPASVGASAMQSIFALLAVFGIMFLIVWILKKGKVIHTMSKGLLKQVAVLPLSNKESVRVIECSDTWLVIGVTTNQITLLHTLSKEDLPVLSDNKSHDIPFKDWLDSTLSRLRKSK